MTTAITKFDVATLTLPAGVELLPDNNQYTNRFNFTSGSGNVYLVAQQVTNRWWACSCPAWKYNRNGKRSCKHLDAFGLPGNYQPFEVGQLAIEGASKGPSKVVPISAPKSTPVAAAPVPRAKKGVRLPAAAPSKALPASAPATTDGLKPKNVAVNKNEIVVTFDAKDAAKVFALLASLA